MNHANVQPVINALQAIGCRPKRVPPLNRIGEHSFVHLLYTPPDEFYDVQFDLLLAETEHEKAALVKSVLREVPGVDAPIRVIDCADLILFKLVSARIIDRANAAMLLRENCEAVDLEYLKGWASKLGVERELAEVWGEAFPGERMSGN